MTSVVTLIAPKRGELADSSVAYARAALEKNNLALQPNNWLAQGQACDIVIETDDRVAAEKLVMQAVAPQAIDVVVQAASARKKKLLISDMDSTMITIECIDEIAACAGIKEQVAAITERAMNGELDFEAALMERVLLLKGLRAEVLQEVYDNTLKFMPGARELVATMKAYGAYGVLVSGGFNFFTARVAQALGFDEHKANILEIKDGVLTGRVIPPILGKEAKLETLHKTIQKMNITAQDVLAVGDGANDLPMLLAAGAGVAYRAKPSVQAAAHMRINHCDLRALLYVQGYREGEIVE